MEILKRTLKTKMIAALCTFAMLVTMLPLDSAKKVKAAEKFPFELMAPSSVAVSWLGGERDSRTTMQFSCSKNSESGMSEWMAKVEDPDTYDEAMNELQDKYGYSDLRIFFQVDWAIDDPENGWHYTKYWDTDGLDIDSETGDILRDNMTSVWDEINCLISNETSEDLWMLRDFSDSDFEEQYIDGEENSDYYTWNGRDEDNQYMCGLKSQLKDGTYEIQTDADGSKHVYIDYDKHTTYVRARYGVVASTDEGEERYFSDWSETAGYGKDVKAWEPYTAEEIGVPNVDNLRVDPNFDKESPKAVFNHNVSDNLEKITTDIAARGGSIYLLNEMRVKGSENWIDVHGDRDIIPGDMYAELKYLVSEGYMIPEGTELEFRCRYFCSQRERDDMDAISDVYSDYSEILTMTSPQIGSGKSIFDETSPSPSASADASVSPSASPSSGAAASEEPINNLNPGASETQVDDYVEKLPNDNDPKGSSFGFIFGRQKKVTKNAITITWKKPSKVDHFVIYGAKCGKKNRYQKITTVKGKSYTQKNLPKGTYHKYLVSAFDSSGTLLGVSNTIHIVTKGGKYCNFKKITTGVKKNKITLAKKGKSAKIKGKAYKENKKLKASVHRPVRYESSNKKVATVNNKGKVVAKKKGKCKIYVFAQNGAYKTVKVTVKK